MAILLSVVFGLVVYPIHVAGGLTLCDTDGTLEVVESTASNVFTCTGAVTTDTITWILQGRNGNNALATCIPDSCNNPHKPRFEASRPADDRSTLIVNGSTTSYLQYIQGQTIVCTTNPKTDSPQQTQCTVDIIAVPSVMCVFYNNTGTSSPWTVTGNCSVSGAYSYLNRYTCNLTQTSPATKSLGSGNLVVTSTSGSGGKYKTGYCQVTVPFQDVTGNHGYKMAVTPGRQDVPASSGSQSSLETTTYIDPEPGPESGFLVGVVVGAIVAVLVVSAIIVVVVLVIRRRRGREQNRASATPRRRRHREEPEMTINSIYGTSGDSDNGAVDPKMKPLSMCPRQPEGSVYENDAFRKDNRARKDHQEAKPEPQGSRTVNPDGLVYVTVGFNEEELKKANDPPPERETTAYAGIDYSKMETQ